MNFLSPLAFSFLAIIPIIILLYLLKLKRKKMAASSTLLWRKSIQDMIANTPFQKLKNNLLMYLQLLILVLLVIALARPYMNMASIKGKSYILILDNSASMQAMEESKTRLDIAKEEAVKVIKNMTKGDRMMIIVFSNKSEILRTFSDDKLLLQDTISNIKSYDTSSNISEALLIANSILKAAANPEIIILSDGAFAMPTADIKPELIRFVKTGKRINNLAIIDLSVREAFENPDEYQIFASVENFGDEIEPAVVDISLNGELIDSRKINVPAGKSVSVVSSAPSNKEGKFVVSIDKNDALQTDNRAYGILAKPEKRKILLVSAGNKFLESAIALDIKNDTEKIEPKDYKDNSGYNLVIFDNFSPKSDMPGNYIYFNAVPPDSEITVKPDKISMPLIIDWDRVHPVMRFTTFDKINISKALSLTMPKNGVKPLAETESSSLISMFEDPQRKILIVGFDIYDSDFPLQVSFPIFISNAVKYMSKESSGAADIGSKTGGISVNTEFGIIKSGENVTIFSSEEPLTAAVVAPDGKKIPIAFEEGKPAVFSEAVKTGFYKIEKTGKAANENESAFFAVNMLSRDESNITPKDAINLSGREIKSVPTIKKENTEIWKWFAIAALFILILEWFIYCRRSYT